MKEKLLCVLEKYADRLKRNDLGQYVLNIDDKVIKLDMSVKGFDFKKFEFKIRTWILFLNKYYEITNEEYNNIFKAKEDIIKEQLNKLC